MFEMVFKESVVRIDVMIFYTIYKSVKKTAFYTLEAELRRMDVKPKLKDFHGGIFGKQFEILFLKCLQTLIWFVNASVIS